LSPASESVGEAMYAAHLTSSLWITGDYQLIVNPAYNSARGPVHVLGARFHADF
jgi:high affinity Mn2+ porin